MTTDPCAENILCHITNLKTEVAKLDSKVDGITVALDEVSTGLDTVEEEVDALEAALEECCDDEGPVVVNESPFVYVDDETEFDQALSDSKSMVLRGEGHGGIVDLTEPKFLSTRFMTIMAETPVILRVTLNPALDLWEARALTINNNDITLKNFEMEHTGDLEDVEGYAIAFTEGLQDAGHRTKIQDLTIRNWARCISKDGSAGTIESPTTTIMDDVLVERCICHTFNGIGMHLNFGFRRLVVRDCFVSGWLTTPIPGITTGNGLFGGSNWIDCLIHNSIFKNVDDMGCEMTPANEELFVHHRTRVVLCRAENCKSMGFSAGFCKGHVFDKCSTKNTVQCGFEIGGRHTGHPASAGHPTFLAQGIIDSCEVDGVTRASAGVYGISLDGAGDTIVRGATRIRNMVSAVPDGDCGIGLLDCERCTVQGVVFEDCGHKMLLVDKGAYMSNTTGFHEFSGNVFRNPSGYPYGTTPNNHCAIFIHNQAAHVRQNTAWQKPGTFLGFKAVTIAGAVVTVDGVPLITGSVNFDNVTIPGSTNVILNG